MNDHAALPGEVDLASWPIIDELSLPDERRARSLSRVLAVCRCLEHDRATGAMARSTLARLRRRRASHAIAHNWDDAAAVR
ncbi:hypothetical protein AB4Y44_36135 [Paraburkholderia sp. BR10937]|uniref:hypothetical protein n=1 Tax=Paraburkholderia sp. BR10937 TaxID=3236994 RepID=UPI0034D32A5A